MELKKLDRRVLKLWYIRAAMLSLVLIGVFAVVAALMIAAEAPDGVVPIVLLGIGIPDSFFLGLTLIMPVLRFRMYAWGYDDQRIIVKEGVIFRHRVVIPICQIQDLHRTQGPLMLLLKLSGVTISTAGSNFDISTLTTQEADCLIDRLEENLEARIKELKNEEI